jgi:hypothetical protein
MLKMGIGRNSPQLCSQALFTPTLAGMPFGDDVARRLVHKGKANVVIKL